MGFLVISLASLVAYLVNGGDALLIASGLFAIACSVGTLQNNKHW